VKQNAVEKYYSVTETAFLLSFEPRWVRERCENGDFPGTVYIEPENAKAKGKGEYRIPASGINEFLAKHQLMALSDALGSLGIAARSETELKRKIRGRRHGTS
jgi:hypothetical protein